MGLLNDRALMVKEDLGETLKLSELLAKSGFFSDTREAAQAVVKVLAGRELGFGPVASMTGIYIVKGKVSLSANLIAAAIKRSGRYTYKVRKLDDGECSIEFFDRNGDQWSPIGTSTFTAADAKRAETQNMNRFPRNMLFARAMSNGAKWFCPDIFGGPVYTPDELGETVDGETGEIVDSQASVVPQAAPTTPPAIAPAATPAPPAGRQRTPDEEAAWEEMTGAVEERATTPEGMANAVRARVMTHTNGGTPAGGVLRSAVFALRTLVPNQDQRHAVAEYLCGSSDPKTWKAGQCGDLRVWVGLKEVGDEWLPLGAAVEDAKVLLAHVAPPTATV